MGSRLVLGLHYCLGVQAHQGHQVGPIGGCGMEVEGVEWKWRVWNGSVGCEVYG